MKKCIAAMLLALFILSSCSQDLLVEPEEIEIVAKKKAKTLGTGE